MQQPGPDRRFEVRGLTKSFGASPRRALDDVSFHIAAGETVALVGESGSGKSTLAKLVLRLMEPDGGELLLDGRDVRAAEPRGASLAYRSQVQMVFQDPFASLNPVHTVRHHLERPLARHGRATTPAARGARVLELLSQVGLNPAAEYLEAHPHELSGGQRQRVAIARALAVEPRLLIADEPTSMLDVSMRMGVLNLLRELVRERRLALLLITHDLASARYLADRVLVLYAGQLVEEAPTEALLAAPAHPYTRLLLGSVPGSTRPAPTRVASGPLPTEGCAFAPRCPQAVERCRTTVPLLTTDVDGRRVRCVLHPTRGTP